jgi:outer membrane protein
MKRLYTLVIVAWFAVSAYGQTQPAKGQEGTQRFTLESCIAYALENATAIKNSTLDQRIAEAKVKETIGIGLPQITGSANVQHYMNLPRMFMTKERVYGFAQPKREDGSALPYDEFMPGVESNATLAIQNLFQLKNSGGAGFDVSQILLNGSYIVGLQAAKAYKDLSAKQLSQSKETTIYQVTKAYYFVLINGERIKLFDSNIERVNNLLSTTSAMHENGFVESIDVDRIKVSLNNLRSEKEKFENMQTLSLLLLKFQMNYPMDQEIIVDGDIKSLTVDENVLNAYSSEWNYESRPDYQLLMSNQRLQELNLKNKYAASLPSLVAFGNYGWSTQSSTIDGLFKTENNFPDGSDKWYPVSYVGVKLTVPIFTGLQQNFRIQQAKLDLMKTQNTIDRAKLGIDLEIKQFAIMYLNAVKTLKSQSENRQLAENVARVTKIKYEEGVGSNNEVIDAESSLREAQINYFSSLYDAIVAKTDLDKAYGQLISGAHPKK